MWQIDLHKFSDIGIAGNCSNCWEPAHVGCMCMCEKDGETFACNIDETVIKCWYPKMFLSLCFHEGGEHTSGTLVLWFQILFVVD